MWTRRRYALLVIGIVGYLALYLAYGRSFLGAIDGLPALPPEYKFAASDPVPEKGDLPPKVDEKLRMAFGLNCPELEQPIKIEVHSKRMVLAAADFATVDGRVRLTPVSVAIFGQDRGDGKPPEINTIRGKVAYLKFDRPVATLQDISGRKIIAAELEGNIEIVNNRRTPNDRSDDLFVYISNGPLYFQDDKHLIWTHDNVCLKDFQVVPKPTEIRGKGMELHLTADSTPPSRSAPRQPKQHQESFSGVEQIVLQSNVDMYLYVDGRSGFMNNQPEGAKQVKLPPGEVPEKAQIHIVTPGRFTYDFGRDRVPYDRARFDIPKRPANETARFPEQVVVTRRQPQSPVGPDEMDCEHLELHLKKKPPAPAKTGGKAGDDPEQAMEIANVHATGAEVTLKSDAQKLDACGVELIYEAATATTTLRGNPNMRANHEGSVIVAPEMQIQEVKQPNPKTKELETFHNVLATGPGQIDMLDKNTGKRSQHAYWTEKLTSTRDGPLDLLVLVGDARFVDDEHDQFLQARTLKVWLEEKNGDIKTPPKPPATAKSTTDSKLSPQQSQRPNHIEGLEDVLAKSKELYVHDTSRLVVWFKDVPGEELLAPAPPSKGGPASPVDTSAGPQPANSAPAAKQGGGPAAGPSSASPAVPKGEAAKKEPQRPIDLSARTVEAWVLRSDERNTLDKLYTEGNVHVQQDPAKADEKGVDIRGDTLQMTYHPDGNFLVVTSSDVAYLRMDKILILGGEVNIDQAANKAWVYGPGAMQMESNTTVSGNKTSKSEPLTVHWNDSMMFGGKFAEFHGSIQAEQDNGHLACEGLQVFFDRPISLKEGNKNEQPAKVQNMVCDRAVRIEETVLEGDREVKYQSLNGIYVAVDTIKDDDAGPAKQDKKENSEVHASGPGSVRIFQRGGPDPMAAPGEQGKPATAPPTGPPGQQPKKPGEEGQLKLTYVTFASNMYANNKTNTAIFRGNVRVLDMPSDSPLKDKDLDTLVDNMPKEAMYMTCDRLTVLTRQENGKASQEMEGVDRVTVRSKEFSGRCGKLTYNEAKDQIIFHGTDTEPARLFRVLHKGDLADEITGKKITYIRSTGDFQVDEGGWIKGRQ
jgi:lipopolysaccharide export system protein LptA